MHNLLNSRHGLNVGVLKRFPMIGRPRGPGGRDKPFDRAHDLARDWIQAKTTKVRTRTGAIITMGRSISIVEEGEAKRSCGAGSRVIATRLINGGL